MDSKETKFQKTLKGIEARINLDDLLKLGYTYNMFCWYQEEDCISIVSNKLSQPFNTIKSFYCPFIFQGFRVKLLIDN